MYRLDKIFPKNFSRMEPNYEIREYSIVERNLELSKLGEETPLQPVGELLYTLTPSFGKHWGLVLYVYKVNRMEGEPEPL